MTNSWLFPPQTRQVQFDEKWYFVGKKEKRCDPSNPLVEDFRKRTGGRLMNLMTSDENPAYAEAILGHSA
jgi:hypothetical protein